MSCVYPLSLSLFFAAPFLPSPPRSRDTLCRAFDSGSTLFKLLYPLLMLVTVFRTLLVRVRPNELLVFKTYDDDHAARSAPNSRGVYGAVRYGIARLVPT